MPQDDQPDGCSTRFPRDLSLFMTGDLAPRRQRQVERHLAECPHCRKQLAQLQATLALLRRAPQIVPPRSFTLPQREVPARRYNVLWYPRLRSATMVLAALVLILSLSGLLQPSLTGLPAPTPRTVAVKPTPRVTPTPASQIVDPAMTRRATPTSGIGILSSPPSEETSYPPPALPSPWIEATVSVPEKTPPTQTSQPVTVTLWRALEGVGLSLLGLFLGLTWVFYRRERPFLP